MSLQAAGLGAPPRQGGPPFLRSGPTTFAVACAAIAGLVSSAVLLGWMVGDHGLIQVGPTFAPMQVNTALCFLCGAGALVVVASGPGVMRHTLGRRVLVGTGVFLVAVSGATLVQYALGINLGIDELLFEAYVVTRTSHPGRMSPWTAIGFLAMGTVVLLGVVAPAPGSRRYTVMAVLTGFVGILASTVLVLYVLELDPALGAVSATRMAVHTASLFWVLAVGAGAALSLGSPLARRAFTVTPVLLGLVVTLTVRQGLIDRDRFVRAASTQEWVTQTSAHSLGLLRLRIEALERMAARVRGGAYRSLGDWMVDATYYSDRVLGGHAVGLVDEEFRIEWSLPAGAATQELQEWLGRPETRTLARRSAEEGVPLLTAPDRRSGPGVLALVMAPVLEEGRAPRFVVGALDYTTAMNLAELAAGYQLRLVVDGVAVLDGSAGPAHETAGSAHLTFAGSTFDFFATPSAERIASSASRLPAVVLATGLTFAVLLGWIQFSAQARARSEARFRALLESAPDAGVIVDAAGRIVDVNSRAETLFGARHTDLAGTPIGALGGSPKLLKPVTDWDWSDSFELMVPRGDQPGLPLEVTASPIQTDEGLLVSMSLRDVTERNAMIDRLRESDRLKSEFVSTVSHEMRTPLTVIREFSSLVHDGSAGPVNPDQAEFLDTVLRNCDRLTGLVGDLLELARLKSGKYRMDRRQTDIVPLLERCTQDLEALAATKEQLLQLDVRGPLPEVLCDSDRVTQVLVNLVGNAHKFTPAGGAIIVRAEAVGPSVAIAVEDTGVGIAEEHHATIFGAFVQVDREDGPGTMGTGLGLNVARQIVELHGGRLTVESQPGSGSTFTFTLPALDEELLTGFLAPHLKRRDITGTPLSLVLLRDTGSGGSGGSSDDVLEAAYNAILSLQRVGRDEALLARKHQLLAVALEADEEGSLGFVRRLTSQLGGSGVRLDYAIRTLDSDRPGAVPTLDDVGSEEWRSLT